MGTVVPALEDAICQQDFLHQDRLGLAWLVIDDKPTVQRASHYCSRGSPGNSRVLETICLFLLPINLLDTVTEYGVVGLLDRLLGRRPPYKAPYST